MDSFKLGVGLVVLAGLVCGLSTGCKKAPPPPPPAPPPRSFAPPAPDPVDTEAMLQQLAADARVQFPNEVAPTSPELTQAIIRFVDAFARGDGARLRTMLDATGLRVLDELQGSGAWEESTKRIEAIRITEQSSGEDSMPSGDFTMAVQEPAAAYLLRWRATPQGNGYIFSPLESKDTVLSRAGDFDGSSSAVVPTSDGQTPVDKADEPEPETGGGGGTQEVGG